MKYGLLKVLQLYLYGTLLLLFLVSEIGFLEGADLSIEPCNTSDYTPLTVSSRRDNQRNPEDKFAPAGWTAVSPGSGREGAPSNRHGDRIPITEEEQHARMCPAIRWRLFKADLHLTPSFCPFPFKQKSFERLYYIYKLILKMCPETTLALILLSTTWKAASLLWKEISNPVWRLWANWSECIPVFLHNGIMGHIRSYIAKPGQPVHAGLSSRPPREV